MQVRINKGHKGPQKEYNYEEVRRKNKTQQGRAPEIPS